MMRKIALTAALATVALLSASPARADLILRITDGTNTVQVSDQQFVPVAPQTNGDANATAGAVAFSGNVGAFNVQVALGDGSPFFQQGHLDLFNVTVGGGPAGGQLDILLTQTGLTDPLNTFTMQFGGTLNAPAGSTVDYRAWKDINNSAFFQTGGLIGALGPFPVGAFSGSVTGTVAGGTTYSLTQRIRLTATGSIETFSGDAELLPAVPEPGTLSLLGTGLFGLARMARRRSRKEPLV
jgi:PEP-CTERM motif-containing protein